MENLIHSTMSPVARLLLIPAVFIASVLLFTRLYTQWRYRKQVRQYARSPSSEKEQFLYHPPQVPYTLPFLGNALDFLVPTPGLFFRHLFQTHPRDTGAATLNLGTNSTHIIFNPHAVNAMFKDRQLSRKRLDRMLIKKCFDVQSDEVEIYYRDPAIEHALNKEYLLKTERVNELTIHFSRVLAEKLAHDAETLPADQDIGLYAWLRDRMFTASTTALMGKHLIEMYPELCTDFFGFDGEMLSFFFSIPNFLLRNAHKRRARLLTRLEEWNRAMLAQCPDGKAIDPAGNIDWEPLFGSRLNRARQQFYANKNLQLKSRAGFDLGLMFGLSSNAIPGTGWILMHLLNPVGDVTLYPRVLAELKTAQRADRSLDVPALITLPLLSSVYHEVLRLYVDVLVTRDVDRDIVLPLNEAGTKSIKLPRDSMVMAPSYLGQHDAGAWTTEEAPVETFYAERFLAQDAETGGIKFTLNGTSGKVSLAWLLFTFHHITHTSLSSFHLAVVQQCAPVVYLQNKRYFRQ